MSTETTVVLIALSSAESLRLCKEWFDAQWLGDRDHGQYIPQNGDKDYSLYIATWQTAYGAWLARERVI